jgi:hypothetical protein
MDIRRNFTAPYSGVGETVGQLLFEECSAAADRDSDPWVTDGLS